MLRTSPKLVFELLDPEGLGFNDSDERTATMQTLRLNFEEGDLPSLHPHDSIVHIRGLSINKTLFEGLTRIDAEGQAKLSGAQSMEISPDRLRYTITLRDNSWSDGSPVTAFQYENAWKSAISPTSLCARPDLLYMIKYAKEAKEGIVPLDTVGVKALNAKTLIVNLANPSPYFLELLAQPIAVPLKHLEKREMTEFNGPFMVSKWEKGSLLQLKPNPYFWNRKKVSIPQIDIYLMKDMNMIYSFYREGKLDYIGMPFSYLSMEHIKDLQSVKSLRSHRAGRVCWIHLNTRHSALSSPWIRQALSMSLQRPLMIEKFFFGSNSMLTALPASLLSTPNTNMVKEDLTEARKRFDLGLKKLGFTKETFPSLVITYSQQGLRKQLSTYLQNRWSDAFGIKVQLVATDWNTLRCNLSKGLYDISFSFTGSFYNDPLELLNYFSCINSNNFSQWVHPEYSAKINAAMQEKELRSRTQYLTEAEQILLEQMPIIPICSDKMLFAHNPNLQGYVFDCPGSIDFSYASFKK